MSQMSLFKASKCQSAKWYIFKNSELGQIYDTIPWDELSIFLPEQNIDRPGPANWFSNAGMFGVMFLKHYTSLSDEKLIGRINTDWAMQLFCGILLQDHEQIKDKAIVSRIRGTIAKQVNLLDDAQKALVDHWSKTMNNLEEVQMDASCYESYIRFPTDVKLLWECCQWVFDKQMFKFCKELEIKRPRSKYTQQAVAQLAYSRKKKKTHKQTRARRKALLYLLGKGLEQLQEVAIQYQSQYKVSINYHSKLDTIKKILDQQQYLFDNPQNNRVEDRIVSLHKPYVRPIKRGKENKSTEFGMKLHKTQVDGINQIDLMSFNNFNECTRLEKCLEAHNKQFKTCKRLGADQIYATNANRVLLTKAEVITCFPKKGKDVSSQEEKEIRSQIGKVRATCLEGSFGNEKNHYNLRKIKAKSEGTEKVWVFFGIMTANAVKMSKRLPPNKQELAA